MFPAAELNDVIFKSINFMCPKIQFNGKKFHRAL
jgi:hypothetical protein